MNRSPKTCAACASLLALVAIGCGAPSERPAAGAPAKAVLSVHDAWARPADSGATTAVYFTLVNASTVPDTLAGVRSADAEVVGVHMSMQQGAMMHMAAVRTLPVPGRDSLSFAPLGAHVMLTRTTRALAVGDSAAVTLAFGSGQMLEVRAGVRQP